MEFHPQKCQLLRVTNKRIFIKGDYHIHNILLKETASAKYLGVTIDSKLLFKDQFTGTIRKANNILAFLKRNFNNCPQSVKDDCYKTLVRPVLEYGSAVWDPHHRVDIVNLEKVQKRAARFATGNYSFVPGETKVNMDTLGWKPLEERRAAIKLNIFFKAKLGLVDIPLNHISTNSKLNSRRQGTHAIPASNVDSHLYSFYPNTIRLWNSLPDAGKIIKSADSFKSYLDKITLRSAF